MESIAEKAEALREHIAAAESELKALKEQLVKLKASARSSVDPETSLSNGQPPYQTGRWPLSAEEYKRYGRQMILSGIGIKGQLRLKNASVLLVGAGGLGCPAAAYLAGAGFGTIGCVDGDVIETSNLHRQILHNTARVGTKKTESMMDYLKALNPNIIYKAYTEHLTPQNAASIVQGFDIVLDCTDHPTSRYLISDICILLRKPLVSASALRTDGQLIVLNHPVAPQGDARGGPCYRCIFPKPPPAESVISCGEGGILGTVVGVMGVLQAGEVIKLVATGGLEPSYGSTTTDAEASINPIMLLYSANNAATPFRTVRLRSRRPDCFACSTQAGLTLESLASGSLDYVAFCGLGKPVNVLEPEERIDAKEYAQARSKQGKQHLLIDVREKVQFDICSLEGSINVPFSEFQSSRRRTASVTEKLAWMPESLQQNAPIYVVCRLGNDSQVVTRQLKVMGLGNDERRFIGDIKGGFQAWKEQVDSSWPDY